MKILIYGAGVIGSLYAVLFSKAGYDVSIYARGKRLGYLKENGLLYRDKGTVKKADVSVKDNFDGIYNFIFLTVRSEQVEAALSELKENKSPTIVTMVNNSKGYGHWEDIVGKGRILPAFPGAGGSIDNNILDAGLTPAIIQPTTFGEINGEQSERIKSLQKILKKSKIPCQIVKNMYNWQISHLGLVVPIADAYYISNDPENVYKDKLIMRKTAQQLKQNFKELSKKSMLSPFKFHLLKLCPVSILSIGLSLIFKSSFGDVFMYRHAMKSPEEMRALHNEFYGMFNAEMK